MKPANGTLLHVEIDGMNAKPHHRYYRLKNPKPAFQFYNFFCKIMQIKLTMEKQLLKMERKT